MASKSYAAFALFLSLNVLISSGASVGQCPIDTLQFSYCATLFGMSILGSPIPPTGPCIALMDGMLDFEAAVCFCGVIAAGTFGNVADVPVQLNMLLNASGKNFPQGFICPPPPAQTP